MKQAVVLAGGLATRMLPLTEATPKILLPVAGRPFLSHLLDRLQESGFDDVVLAIGHLAHSVRAVAEQEADRRGLDIRLSEAGPRLLGTGGALRNAAVSLVGYDGGALRKLSTASVVVPTTEARHTSTPHVEGYHEVYHHLICERLRQLVAAS